MSNEVQKVDKPTDPAFEVPWRRAKAIAVSGLTPYRKPEAVFAVVMAGEEMGIPPMTACRTIYFFDGKLTMAATLMDSLASSKCGVSKEVIEHTDKACRMKFHRAGRPSIEVDFTIEEAQKAGLLGKDNWRKYPKDMLAARCTARGVRLIAPDYFAGAYAREEFDNAPDFEVVPDNARDGVDDLNAAVAAIAEDSEAHERGEPSQPETPAVATPHLIKRIGGKGAPEAYQCSCSAVFRGDDCAERAESHKAEAR